MDASKLAAEKQAAMRRCSSKNHTLNHGVKKDFRLAEGNGLIIRGFFVAMRHPRKPRIRPWQLKLLKKGIFLWSRAAERKPDASPDFGN